MDKKFQIVLEEINSFFHCSIPELKLTCKSESLPEAYEKIQSLKNERLKACSDYDDLYGVQQPKKNNAEDIIKKSINIVFFLLLTFGIGSHLVIAIIGTISQKTEKLLDNISQNTEKFFLAKTLKNLGSLSPEEKKIKLIKFQGKLDNAQKILVEAKPFIEASKPFLKNLEDSFDLKHPSHK